MKYPIGFRVFASIQLLLGLSFFLLSAVMFDDFFKGKYKDFSYIILTITFLSIAAWSIMTSIIWFFKFKTAYISLFLTILANIIVYSFSAYRIAKVDSDPFILILILGILMGIYVLFMVIYSLLNNVKEYSFNSENKPKQAVLIATIVTFVIIIVLPPVITAMAQKFGHSYKDAQYSDVRSSGDYGEYVKDNAVDSSLKTWWTPSNRHGHFAWLQVNLSYAQEITAVEIHPGSHYPDYPNYGNLFKLNRRLIEAKLIFDDGTSQIIQIADRDKKQLIKIEPRETTSLRLMVLRTEKGQKWDDLCISHFMPKVKEKLFRER